jgi:hypothetical protein
VHLLFQDFLVPHQIVFEKSSSPIKFHDKFHGDQFFTGILDPPCPFNKPDCNINITNSKFVDYSYQGHNSDKGGCIFMENSGNLIYTGTLFERCRFPSWSCLYVLNSSFVEIDNCNFAPNYVTTREGLLSFSSINKATLSNSFFFNNNQNFHSFHNFSIMILFGGTHQLIVEGSFFVHNTYIGE